VKAINADNLSIAWLDAVDHMLATPKGKDVNLVVAFRGIEEDPAVRPLLDAFLAARSARRSEAVYPIDTVASTLFPQSWYVPERAPEPRQHLYRCFELAQRVHKRVSGEEETYFGRLVRYPGPDGGHVNQLEEQVTRLQGQLRTAAPKSSAYEIGVVEPADLRLQVPGRDRLYMGFPCLSHISVTLHGGAIHLTALYRNQGFLRKAYGNYVGLARLGRFFATELGVAVGEIACVASHADAELDVGTKSGLRQLVSECRDALGSAGPVCEVDRAA
jgi:hypothetical protein